MRKNKKLFTWASWLLLWGTAILAGCSQADDTLPSGAAVARGGEPLNIRIAPKPGYREADAADTRVTVNDFDGTFAWADGDVIYLHITFDDAAGTKAVHKWTRAATSTTGYASGWNVTSGWGADGAAVDRLVWPLGASSAVVKALYVDGNVTVSGSTDNPDIVDIAYPPGSTCENMTFSRTIALGEELTVGFEHTSIRFVIAGLEPNTGYGLTVDGAKVKHCWEWLISDLTFGAPGHEIYTTDADGTLTVCIGEYSDLVADGEVRLGVVKDGIEQYIVDLPAQGTPGAYKMNGYMYKQNVSKGGAVNPGDYSNLLSPDPIIPGFDAVEINGYWVAIPTQDFVYWAASPSATVMENDPCAGHGNWRLPTMKDFEKMAGWTETWPWSETVGNDQKEVLNRGAWDNDNGFGDNGWYWSSVVSSTDPNMVWVMNYPGGGNAYYSLVDRGFNAYVRCVQPK